ncbi:MAG: FAD-binding oxidoreductase, partial [Candidatus Eremiobacteraeota bacterium]|nr:FAD-binding oxidoreductase [Candidatus Eremiobacteraeota bacterium]
MAGAFGFEAGEHYDVSIACGELGYLPHVRETSPRDLVVSDGFSCREQAMQTTNRQVLHLADVIWLAQRHGPDGPDGDFPEHAAMPRIAEQVTRARRDFAVGAGVLVLTAGAIAAAVAAVRRRRRR